jgi:NAD(P)-dependent dehydrogenase (short-subunit alcohol dehydrogenase family)
MTGAAIVIGAGDATGGAIAAAFARTGLVAVPVRRTADALAPLAERIAAEGGRCLAVGCDARDEAQMVSLFERVEAEIGAIEARPRRLAKKGGRATGADVTRIHFLHGRGFKIPMQKQRVEPDKFRLSSQASRVILR